MTFYHISQIKLAVDTMLTPTQTQHLSADLEALLERNRPDGCLPRHSSVFLSESIDGARHGLKYSEGYIHEAEPVGEVQIRDNRWIGELQLRHSRNEKVRARQSSEVRGLPDEVVAGHYWSGDATTQPNWEAAVAKARITKQLSDQPIKIGGDPIADTARLLER